jgi:EmrB/QacA subfamily drug resistance transporter
MVSRYPLLHLQEVPRVTQARSRGKWAVFTVVAIGVFMGTLDASIVNISLPTMARDFQVPLGGAIEWVVIAYLVVSAATLLSAGRLSDMIGRKRVWVAGLAIFTASSALCGAAFSLWFLVVSRALQGLGGALLFSSSPALLTSAFPGQERGRALGLNAVVVSLGTSVGPTLGGIITGSLSWRWIFYVNVPLGIVGTFLSLRVLSGGGAQRAGRFDPWGAGSLGVGLASLIAALTFSTDLGLDSPFIISAFVLGVGFLAAFAFIERRVPDPVVKFSLLRSRVFLSANLSLILSFLALFAVSFLMPFYLEQLRDFPTEIAGLLLTPLPIMIAMVAPLSGMISDRIGSTRWLAAGGLLIACVGLILTGLLDAHSSVQDIIWRLLVIGFGQALFQAPNNSALMGSAPHQHRGLAAGFLATGRVIGQSLSVALAGAVFTGLGGAMAGVALEAGGVDVVGLQNAFLRGFRTAMFSCAAVAVVGVLASLIRGKQKMDSESNPG